MKVSQILKATPKTQNLIAIGSEVTAQDFLTVVRHAAQKLCHLGYLYINSRGNPETILAKDPSNLSFDEFNCLVSERQRAVAAMLDRKYTLADFQLMEWLKPKKTTPKREILKYILGHPEILYEHFREETIKVIVESMDVLKNYDRIGRDGYALYYRPDKESDTVPGTQLLEYWRLVNSYGLDLHINLLEEDAAILHKIETFTKEKRGSGEFRVEVCGKQLLPKQDEQGEIFYRTDIYDLEKEFGIRKQSKKATFAEGLRCRKDTRIIQKLLGSKVFISQSPPRIGETLTQEIFEAVVLHLDVLFVDKQGILCEVARKETEQIVHALWGEHTIRFYPVLVAKGGESK